MWNDSRCHQVPCLPRESCVSPSATPATWNDGGCHQVPRLPRESCVWQVVCDKVVCVTKLHVTNLYVTKLCVTKLCVSKFVVTKCMWQSCMWQSCMWQSCMWQFVCNKCVCVCVWQVVWQSCAWQSCVWQVVCDKVEEEDAEEKEAAAAADTPGGCRSKNKNPTQFCGEKIGHQQVVLCIFEALYRSKTWRLYLKLKNGTLLGSFNLQIFLSIHCHQLSFVWQAEWWAIRCQVGRTFRKASIHSRYPRVWLFIWLGGFHYPVGVPKKDWISVWISKDERKQRKSGILKQYSHIYIYIVVVFLHTHTYFGGAAYSTICGIHTVMWYNMVKQIGMILIGFTTVMQVSLFLSTFPSMWQTNSPLTQTLEMFGSIGAHEGVVDSQSGQSYLT